MNLSNALTVLRLLCSPALTILAVSGQANAFLYVLLILEVTDWLDGRLARLLDQRSEFGARLDSIADMAMYAMLLSGVVVLEREVLFGEWPWLGSVVATYAAAWISSLTKFGQMPACHTVAARSSSLLAVGAAVGLLVLDLAWPVRVTAAAVSVANLEAVAITLIIDTPQSDVASLVVALRDERA